MTDDETTYHDHTTRAAALTNAIQTAPGPSASDQDHYVLWGAPHVLVGEAGVVSDRRSDGRRVVAGQWWSSHMNLTSAPLVPNPNRGPNDHDR